VRILQKMNTRFAGLLALLRELRSWLLILVGLAAVVWMLLWAGGVFHPKVHALANKHADSIPEGSEVLILKTFEIPRYETAVGTIQAVHEAAVASKILARIEEVNVTAGQKVRAGEILVRLQDQDLRARLGQVDSNLVAAQARQTQAQSEFQRANSLLAQSAISQSEYQSREADLRSRKSKGPSNRLRKLGYNSLSPPSPHLLMGSSWINKSKRAIQPFQVRFYFASMIQPKCSW
jgi:multidrug efflux pump subunit AcrA (membrane-fusion protein)